MIAFGAVQKSTTYSFFFSFPVLDVHIYMCMEKNKEAIYPSRSAGLKCAWVCITAPSQSIV